MKKNIAVILGDGIGPEVTQQAIKVLNAIADIYGHEFVFKYGLMGAVAIEKTGEPLPDETVELALESDAILFGAIGDPKYDNDPYATVRPEQGLLKIRKVLQLYGNIRPITIYPSLMHLSPLKESKIKDVDFVIFRELTSGIYFGNKHTSADGLTASDECTYNTEEIERIAHLAFKHARKRRNKLTLVDKANVLETSRLWRKTVQKLAHQYADVQVNYLYADNASMQLIQNPQQFDVILTDNMFGDILSFEASIFNGTLGLVPSASVGNITALFEPIHGSYPQAAGKDIANPIGSILSAALMLDYFGLHEEANKIREAVAWTLNNKFVTKDIDPINFYFTSTLGDLITEYVGNKISGDVNHENIELRKSTVI
jgi:3-isopropylmalate dehydrogenase